MSMCKNVTKKSILQAKTFFKFSYNLIDLMDF